LTGEELVQAVPEIKEVARVEVEQICNVGSTDMDPAIWVRLAKRANELLAGPDVAGVVVTHGTDTMEETAYFLDLTVTSQKPVVLVGAQRAAVMKDSDGPRNLLNAIRVAVSPEAAGKGAMIVMNGQINAAREVTKTNTIEGETFRTLEFGQLGYADLKKVRFYRAPLRRQTIPLGDDPKLGRVEIVSHYGGNDGWVLRALLKQGGIDGLVIAGTGLGNVGTKAIEAVKEARDKGIPVVVSTRVYTGRVMPLYATGGGGLALQKIGCVQADNLSPQKARILLMLALTKTKSPEELQKIFDH
jgi:L-asparaginase